MSSFYESPQCHLNIYLCQICESNSHYGYECSQRVPLVYESEPCYTQHFSDNDYSHDLLSVNPLIDHHCCHECGNSLNDFFCHQCTCEFYGNGAHVGYNCPAQVPSFQTLPSFPQQYPCCEDYGVTHEACKCQPMNKDYYHEQNSCYDSNSIGFDQFQPQQYTVNHHIFNAHNDFLDSQNKLTITLTKVMKQMTSLTFMCELACQIVQKKQEENQIEKEQAAKAQNWKLPVCYDDDDDEERSNSLKDNIIFRLPPCSAITPNEPVDSLSMGDEHFNTIPAMESDKFIKSSVENLIPNPSESEGESECDMPACEAFTTLLNVLFDADYDFYSVDDQSLSDEDFSKEIYLNPLFAEEIIPMKIDPHSFNAESDLIESMLYHDSSIIISSKIDSLFDEFADELTLLKSISSRIDETDCHPEEETHFTKRLLYDNSSPRPPEEFVYDNSDADIESFSPSPIPIKDNDYDSERDIPILEDLLDNYSLSLPENESYHFDISSFSRPPTKPPDGNTGILNIKMMGDISNQKVPIPNLMITRVSNQEKSPDRLSHQGLEIFQPSAKCPMIINGKNTPILESGGGRGESVSGFEWQESGEK
nr:hypothetical protein [Tanacetum cinerariifolium]